MKNLLEKLTKEALIRVIANMHDTVEDWNNGNGLLEDEAKILNEIGSACISYCAKSNFDLPIIKHLTESKMKTHKERVQYVTGNIKISNEQLKKTHIRFLSDRRITRLTNEIAAIYIAAIPRGLIKTDGSFEMIYDDKVEYEVKRVRSVIEDIVKIDYTDLVSETQHSLHINP